MGGLKVQVGQFCTIVDSNDIPVEKLIKILIGFGKNYRQKFSVPEVFKLAKLNLVMPATNTTCEQHISAVKHIKIKLPEKP